MIVSVPIGTMNCATPAAINTTAAEMAEAACLSILQKIAR